MPGMKALLRVYYGLGALIRELMKFGVVGLVAFSVDIVMFNVLLHATDKPLSSKTLSTVLATTVAYFGNRYWTFRHRARSRMRREYTLFFLLNGVGLCIALGCLAISHYLLGFTSTLADNIAANVIGLGLGTTFRFWSYRRFVFRAKPDEIAPIDTVEGIVVEQAEEAEHESASESGFGAGAEAGVSEDRTRLS
jgi:putative flippase GtrA